MYDKPVTNPATSTMTTQTETADDDAPIQTSIYGDWNDARERIAEEIQAACGGTPDKIELKSDGEIVVTYTDNESPFITMQGGVTSDDLPAGCTFHGINVSHSNVMIQLNHRAIE